MTNHTILVAGATGLLGGAITRKLLRAGLPVRALGRSPEKLAALEAAGAETVAVDLLDKAAVLRACKGVAQVVSSANNVMGSGQSSPRRIDVRAYQNLCAAAKEEHVRRIVHISAHGIVADSLVDFFRMKVEIDRIVRDSGVPYVLLQPTSFMEIWVGMIEDGIRKNGVAVLFGNGQARSNFIAVEDVAEFALRIVQREEIVNEAISVGGPSNMSYTDVSTAIARTLGVPARSRKIPVPILRVAGAVLGPFHELGSRMMLLGHHAATRDGSFSGWRESAQRFGVEPRTVEQYLEERSAASTSTSSGVQP